MGLPNWNGTQNGGRGAAVLSLDRGNWLRTIARDYELSCTKVETGPQSGSHQMGVKFTTPIPHALTTNARQQNGKQKRDLTKLVRPGGENFHFLAEGKVGKGETKDVVDAGKEKTMARNLLNGHKEVRREDKTATPDRECSLSWDRQLCLFKRDPKTGKNSRKGGKTAKRGCGGVEGDPTATLRLLKDHRGWQLRGSTGRTPVLMTIRKKKIFPQISQEGQSW